MRCKKYLGLVALIPLLISTTLAAADRGSLEEAKAMAIRAATFLKDKGPDIAFAAFHDREGRFVDRDLYVFVQDFECTFHAHGANPSLIGRNIWNLINPNGRYACRDIMEVTKKHGHGWTDYIFTDPNTGNLAWKSTYSIAVGNYVVMVGAYKPR